MTRNERGGKAIPRRGWGGGWGPGGERENRAPTGFPREQNFPASQRGAVPPGLRNEERGTRNEERGRRNEERGTRNEERGTRNEERATPPASQRPPAPPGLT